MASEDEFILETFLHGCFSKAAADIFVLEILTHIYISYFDVMLKKNGFYVFFKVNVSAKSVGTQN